MAKVALNPPDLSTPGGRLRWARERASISSTRVAAQSFGWNENTYKSHEVGMRGREGFKTKTAEKYAKAYGVSVEWLLTGRGSPLAESVDRQWAAMTAEERELALRLARAARGR